MTITRTLVGLLALLLLAPTAASAVTVDQIVAMSKAGVTDAVIIALIERDKTVFALDPAQLVELQQAGVAEAVTVAMLRSDGAREQPNAASPDQSASAPPEQPAVVAYAVPYAVPVPVRVRRTCVVALAPAAQPATAARGIFFTQPSTGIFFPPPAAASCPAAAASARPR
jgi:hypothetical protein